MINIGGKELVLVQDILRKYLSGEEARVFGSRITGRAHNSSDLDLAVISKEKLSYILLAKVGEEFTDSTLQFSVDIIDMNRVSESFQRIINAHYVVLSYD